MPTSTLRFAVIFLLMVGSPCASFAKQNTPNVLLILVDDLKPSLNIYGDKWVHSPNIDHLASRGVRFDMAYCNQAVCAPSRYNLMLGSRSTSLGIYGLSTPFRKVVPEAITLPQFFKKHGYHAAGVGKVFHIGHGNTGDEQSWSEPFHPDKVVDYALLESTGGQLTREEAYFSNQALDRVKQLPRGMAWERADVEDNAYADGRIAEEGIRQLQVAKNRESPFFLALGFVKPHLPFCAPEKYWAIYDDVDFPLAANKEYPVGSPAFAGKPKHGELNQYKPIPESPPLEKEIEKKLVQGYYASLSYMDAQVGRVLDELDRLHLRENTIVVLWGDHGFHLGDHGAWTKHTNYEQANRIPLIFAGPGINREGVASDALVETVDVYPTLADLAGLSQPVGPQPIDGVSLVPLVNGTAESVRDHAYHAFPRSRGMLGRAVRDHRYRLVEWNRFRANQSAAKYELYDYSEDPQETKNLAKDRPRIVESMRKMLAKHPPAREPFRNEQPTANNNVSTRESLNIE